MPAVVAGGVKLIDSHTRRRAAITGGDEALWRMEHDDGDEEDLDELEVLLYYYTTVHYTAVLL